MDYRVAKAETLHPTSAHPASAAVRPLPPPARHRPCRRTRRTWSLAAGLALAALLPPARPAAAADACSGTPFIPIGEITSGETGKLQAVIKAVNGKRKIAGTSAQMMRYFEGYNPADPNQKWPLDPSAAGPGPTLRAKVGDVVNITFLNQVKVQDFGGTLDSGEEGRGLGCDQTTKVNADGSTDKNWYPGYDKFPNCFHASSSANIHYHGTHVTPSTTGDNVLIDVRPNQKVTERDVQGPFGQIFQRCQLGQQPMKWGDLPQAWRDMQEALLKEYDRTAPYVGPGRNPDGHGLPPNLQLWPQNQKAIDMGLWPQYYDGSYPYCFQIPRCPVNDHCTPPLYMGQAPGTHWYHSHKHGSTALNLFNGMAGALIIADDSPDGYDGKLRAFYQARQGRLDEKVLVFEQLATVINLTSATGGGSPATLVNGQQSPVIQMRTGEVQLWRMINADVQSTVNAGFSSSGGSASITFRQTARDGVQFAWKNYSDSSNGTQTITLAPANRIDLLVQAPATPGCYQLIPPGSGQTALVYITVTGNSGARLSGFPTQESQYPQLPVFLADVDPGTIHERRDITYGSRNAQANVPASGNPKTQTQFTINGKQFEDGYVNQVMLLDTDEEWTLYNADILSVGRPAHPFHIHVNPFQIVEVYAPKTNQDVQPTIENPPYVWWDTFAIPSPAQLAAGQKCYSKVITNPTNNTQWCAGYFKMRTRFVDFTGQFVQHCHILAHEDRGMMQLLEVVTNKTPLKHH
jgi:FtsP/CotA-like multicopper oxidase with cupredoxin domain